MANTRLLVKLMTGKLDKTAPVELKTSEKYIDGSGKPRWKGTSSLKQTQQLDLIIMLGRLPLDGSPG